MASPMPGGGMPRMPRQPGGIPELIVDPIIPGRGRLKRSRLPKPKKDRLGRPLIGSQPFPGPQPYAPIKQTKAVGKVYKTY